MAVEELLRFEWWTASAWSALALTLGPPATRALVVGILAWFLARAARSALEHALRPTRADANLRVLAGRLVYLLVLAIGALTILDAFGVPLSAVVTLLGVVGIGIGLALQDILKSFFAGIYLLFERPFRIGEEVSVKEYRGIVETIGIRTTTLRTRENALVLIPNAMVLTEIVANRTYERAVEAESTATPAPAAVAADGLTPGPTPVAPASDSRFSPAALLELPVVARWVEAGQEAASRLTALPDLARQAGPLLRCQLRRFWL